MRYTNLLFTYLLVVTYSSYDQSNRQYRSVVSVADMKLSNVRYKRYYHVWNEVRPSNHTFQAWCFSLFGHITQIPEETDDKKILTASPSENWSRPRHRDNDSLL